MTDEFKTILCIASAGARGCELDPGIIKSLNLDKTLKLAQEHSVLELVLLALRKCRNEDGTCVLNREHLFAMRQAISVNVVKKQSILALIREMEAAEIPVLLGSRSLARQRIQRICEGHIGGTGKQTRNAE